MTSAAPFLSRYRDMLGLFVLMTAVSLNMLLLSAIAPVLSTIARHFGTGGGAALRAQSIITLSGIGIMLGGPLAGWIGDRIGLRRLLVLSLALYGLMGSGGLYLESAAALLGSRVIQGMASAGIGAATFALLANRFDGAARARILGYQGALVAAAGAVTLLMTGEIARHWGWRAPFALYLMALPMILLVLAARLPDRAENGMTAQKAPSPSAALLPLWPLYALIVPLYGAAYMFYLHLSFVMAGDGISDPAAQSRIMTAITLLSIVSGLAYGRVHERLGGRITFATILAIMAAGNLLVGLSHGAAMTALACAFAGLGTGALGPYITGLVLGRAPADLRGRAMGFLSLAMYVGDFLNPLVITPMRGAFGNHAAFLAVGLLLALAAALRATLKERLGKAALA